MNALALSNFCFADTLVRARLNEYGEPLFVAKDVCAALGIANSRDAINFLDEDEKAAVGITDTSSNGVTQQRIVNFITESGLYSLIFRSHKPEARTFRKWVTAEVLPALRKNGSYGAGSALAVHASAQPAPISEPEFIVPDCAMHLRSATRLKILWSAVRAADMENSGGAGIARYFEAFCKLVAQVPTSEANLLESFADECLSE
ncbi:MAG: Bro-N domain-containing protein [Desulfovibrionaceae bacterium]|nr:Bro-N domain-containing protein [Desulfovibrionaceae bacterium]